ncbi:hypothetical protein [Streptomyces scabiei]|uniref:hypothetical protein n=1 Tax=Streptomyces scabiei TaxID=1930 RepID=UPI0029A7A738|nr:hypothetical protein [Streptomyces scabiei]MDX3028489.1 hypothetical protein [Streptomyces scabiei]
MPFERAAALLSIVKPVDILLAARVGLSGKETMGHLHDLIDTVTRNIFTESSYGEFTLASDVALEVVVSKRHELALHTAHVEGLTRLLRDAVGTIGAGSAPGEGKCCHCRGTGLARPLWKPPFSASHNVA